jgi:cyclic 2,3-diphosphoglycerate synthetase
MRILVLIDGEHYPSVTYDAVQSLTGDVKAAVFLGGTEKIGSIEELINILELPVYQTKAEHETDISLLDICSLIATVCKRHRIDQVIDLSDEPILNYVSRFQIASTLMKEGVQYKGADFLFVPPSFPKILTIPSLGISGTAKRVGKTAISGYIARTLKAHGYQPCIVTMGRGGPAEPEIIRGDQLELTSSYLIEQADAGKHAASDHWENALTSRVITVGCRRCGGGMAGTPFTSNVPEGANIANTLETNFVIMEGSGITIPPVLTDKHIVLVGAHQPVEFISKYFGPFRILLSDLVILMMCEEPMATPEKVAAMEKAINDINPEIGQAHCIFRPRPLGNIKGKNVFLATTAPPSILRTKIVSYLEETYDCHVVGASPHLSDRSKMRKDLDQFLSSADILLTEVKASAIDVVTREALAESIDVIYMDNVPLVVGGTVKDLDGAILQLAEEASS